MKPNPSRGDARSSARRVGELERLGADGRDVLVLGLPAPDFDALPTRSKILAYYFYRAAIAGDSILYDQNHRDGVEIRDLLESILINSQGLDRAVRDAVHDYLKYFWIHHGNYHHATHTKFVPSTLTPELLARAAEHARKNGATIVARPRESLEKKLQRLSPTIFDADYEPVQSNQVDGVDMVATSAVNFWDPGITTADIDALGPEWSRRVNVRFARGKNKVEPEVYRIGGLYSRELETVSHFLRLALPYAEESEQRQSIEALLDFYASGDEESFRRHSIHWLRSDTQIDYLNGFIEHYIDPRGVIGNYEANTSYAADLDLVRRISANALYFETRMPWPDRYKREKIEPPVAKVVDVIVETGDAGPVSPAAYNLPNYNDLRRDYGSKNVIFRNVENTRSEELHKRIVEEFYLPDYRANVLEYQHSTIRPLEVYLHEIIGHGSGRPDPDLTTTPRAALGRAYSALEECRADLVALYHLSDPKLVEIGAVSAEEHNVVVETAYITYTQGWMIRFDRVPGGLVREAHNKGSHAILMYLVENGFGLDVIERRGDFFVRLRDADEARRGIAELLEKIQVMKSTGDGRGAAALFDRFGTHIRPEWRRNMIARIERVKAPQIKAFVFPRLKPTTEGNEVVDVQIRNDETLTDQQLRFRRLRNTTSLNED